MSENGFRRAAAALALVIATAAAPLAARAACPDAARVAAAAEAFFAKRPAAAYGPALTVEEAYCAQKQYVALLEKRLGARAGYKVAFAGKTAQERFGVKEPARGTLFRSMLLESGSTIGVDFGVRPLVEPDLVVTVKDAGINDARTPLQALQHLEAVVTFIELPDLLIAEGETVNGPNIIAFNAAARYGVTGDGVPVNATPAFLEALARMEAVLTDETGKELSRTKGESLMGNPINALLWLIENLRREGLRMEPGDPISLGAMGPILKAEARKSYTVRYEGLPGGKAEVKVSIR